MEDIGLYHKLKEYSQLDYYPFHMPGHKRNFKDMDFVNPYSIDITEIEGFDNLHHPQDIIKECEERAAQVYKSEETHYLINGSTVGILSAIAGCTNRGDKIIMARNCHKSAYHGVFLCGLEVEYIYPQIQPIFGLNGGLSLKRIEEMLIKHKNIKAIFITSPTYDGIVSDVRGISKIAHKYHIPLIVDEAHGAHFGFHEDFPENSVKAGADIVIHSLHKTLPSLTQTALIHLNGNLIDREKIKKYLTIYQSSSPSYVLMSSIDKCIEMLYSNRERLFSSYADNLNFLRESLNKLKHIKLLNRDIVGTSDIYDLDPSKIILSVKNLNINGYALYKMLLNDYHLQMEMVLGTYVLGMTSTKDKKEGFIRLSSALKDIDENRLLYFKTDGNYVENEFAENDAILKNNIVLSISDAENRKTSRFLIEESVEKISAEFVYVYPPGIPILVPGEEISQEVAEKIRYYRDSGLSVEGMEDKNCRYIKCCL